MLVLSRKPNQEIIIGENIKITILQIKGNTVRVGIEAPREIRVMRGELSAISTPSRRPVEMTLTFRANTEVETAIDDPPILPLMPRNEDSPTAHSPRNLVNRQPERSPIANRIRDIFSRATLNASANQKQNDAPKDVMS